MKTVRAFTLVELLVVIAIITVLIGILMPALRIARQQATATVCVTNIKGLLRGWSIFADDHNGRLLPGNTGEGQWVDVPRSPTFFGEPVAEIDIREAAIERGLLWPYIETYDSYHCPGDQRPLDTAYLSYSVSGAINGEEGPRAVKRYPDIKLPALQFVFVEESDARGWNMGSWIMHKPEERWIDPLAIWHNERSSLGFADGHVEIHTWIDERTIKMSLHQLLNEIHPDNPDLLYMQRGYPKILDP